MPRSRFGLAAALLALAATAGPVRAQLSFDARVVAVLDGDTIEVVRSDAPGGGKEQVRIRLAGIDAPESGQPWSSRARKALSRRIYGKRVGIRAVTTDRYGRTVAEVDADGACVGCELVREGHAWVYRGFTEDAALFELEAEARAARRGLWSLPEAERIPPWRWRETHREPAPASRSDGGRSHLADSLVRRPAS